MTTPPLPVWELLNPSDPYTFETADHDVALVVCVLLGVGLYGAREIGGAQREVPLMLFGADEAWCRATFDRTVEEVFAAVADTKREALVAALDSFLIGSAADRASYRLGLELLDPAKHDTWRAHWHDQRRSSLSDIGRCAWARAEELRQARPGGA